MKGLQIGGKETQFKKGQTPINYRPVGSERINVDGYIEIKIADPRKWKAKHVVVWESENGSVPKGHVIIFGDRNRLNIQIDNLILISRKQLVTLNIGTKSKYNQYLNNWSFVKLFVERYQLAIRLENFN